MTDPSDAPIVDDDPIDAALAVRRPSVAETISDLAARKHDAVEIIHARGDIVETLRRRALQLTHPEDWVLFKSPDEQGGQTVGYLQDAGCDRVRDLWGIEVFSVGRPERIAGTTPGHFHYVITGSGRCKLTTQVVEMMEGGRSSTDDFCRDKDGAELELAVRKAARANLDGNITRELAGMKSVPIDELARAWDGTPKRVDGCRLGRGFGSRSERLGGTSAKAPDVAPPVCTVCGTPGAYRPAKDGRAAFYGCPNYSKHRDRKWIVDAEQWIKAQQAAAPSPPAAAPGPTPAPTPAAAPAERVEPPPVGEIKW